MVSLDLLVPQVLQVLEVYLVCPVYPASKAIVVSPV